MYNMCKCLAYCCIVLMSLCPSSALAQAAAEAQPVIFRHSIVGKPRPNLDLPSQIPADDGKLTFFADFASKNVSGVPLYLVNRTREPLSLASQDNDIYVKLEHQLPDGRWERAQTYYPSDCGLSYYSITLNPGQYFMLYGYMPSSGLKARVRFASHNKADLTSNEGDGFVLEQDVQASQVDLLARGNIPSSIADALDPSQGIQREQSASIEEQIAAVRLLKVYGNNVYYRKCAEQLAAKWEVQASPSTEETIGAKIMRDLLSAPWAPDPNPEALFTRCIEALKNNGANHPEFGMPEKYPALVWETLASLGPSYFSPHAIGYRDQPPDPKRWKPVTDLAASAFNSKNQQVMDAAAAIVCISPLADELLANSFFEENLFHADSSIQRVCAHVLSRRMEWKKLAQIGWKLPPEGKLIVLRALAYPQENIHLVATKARNPESEEEEEFWTHCMETMPARSSDLLYMYRVPEYNPFNSVVYEPLHKYIENELRRSEAASHDFELNSDESMQRSTVNFLASWQYKADTLVLQKLLGYRGYRKQSTERPDPKHPGEIKVYDLRNYSIRAAAKEALLKRGVQVPQNIVLQKKVMR